MEISGAPRRWTLANHDATEQGRDTDLAIRESVRPLLLICAAIQGCASLYYGPSVSGPGATTGLAFSAVMSGILCFLVWKGWDHWPSHLTGYIVGGVFASLLMYSLLRIAYDPHYGQPGELALIIVACGATLLSRHWVAIASVTSVLTWCAIAIPTLAAPVWIPGGALLIAATGMALALLKTRIDRHEQAAKDEAKMLRWLRRLQAGLDSVSAPVALLDTSGRLRAHNIAWRGAAVLFPSAGSALSAGADFFQVCRAAGQSQSSHAKQLARGVRQVAEGMRDSYSQVCPVPSGEIEVAVSRREIIPGGFGLTMSQAMLQYQPPTPAPVADHQPVLDLLLKGSKESVWEWDLVRKRMHLSADWRNMLGYAEDEITTDPDEWLERIHSRDLQTFMAAVSAHIEGHTELFEAEHRIRNKAGEYVSVTVRGLATRDENGRATRLAGTVEAHLESAPRIEPASTDLVQESLAELSAGSRAG